MLSNVTDFKTLATDGLYFFWSSIVVAVLSPVAVVGNALVLVAIWRNSSLRTPSYILLAGLAFTDFCTGFISQPFSVLLSTWSAVYVAVWIVGECFITYFFTLTVFMITLMSIERWLHMSRRSLITVRRTCVAIAMLLLLSIPLVVWRVLYKFKIVTDVATISFLLFCLTVTSVAYYNVFRIIRRHQHQVMQMSTLSQNHTVQPAVHFAKYKKSVFTILHIVAIFYAGYLPFAIATLLTIVYRDNEWNILFVNISVVLVFLSSSLNPLLYLWRMKDIRKKVAQLVKGVLCKHNAN